MNVVRQLRRLQRNIEISEGKRKRPLTPGTYGRHKLIEEVRLPGRSGWWSYHATKGWRRDTPADLQMEAGNRSKSYLLGKL